MTFTTTAFDRSGSWLLKPPPTGRLRRVHLHLSYRLPFILLTLGLVYFLINGLMLMLASALVPGFRVGGLLPAVLGSILLTLVDYLLNRLAGV
jgi:uncharacterized membrane protein YvlD (DUF360 family)